MNINYLKIKQKIFGHAQNCHRPECNAVATGRSKNHTLARDLFVTQAVFVLGRSTISSKDCIGPDRHGKIRNGHVVGDK